MTSSVRNCMIRKSFVRSFDRLVSLNRILLSKKLFSIASPNQFLERHMPDALSLTSSTMKGRRPCFSFFLCCLFTFGLATEVKTSFCLSPISNACFKVFGNRHPFARHNIDSKYVQTFRNGKGFKICRFRWRRDHDRRLSSVYDVEECQWIQGWKDNNVPSKGMVLDASCQINPTYARHLLSDGSSRSSQEVQDAILGEAECLTMTHEGRDVYFSLNAF